MPSPATLAKGEPRRDVQRRHPLVADVPRGDDADGPLGEESGGRTTVGVAAPPQSGDFGSFSKAWGSSADVITATKDTAMNPAVVDAFALLAMGAAGARGYPGIVGHEPNAVAPSAGASTALRGAYKGRLSTQAKRGPGAYDKRSPARRLTTRSSASS